MTVRVSGYARLSVSRISAICSEFPAGERLIRANGKQRYHGTGSQEREKLALKEETPTYSLYVWHDRGPDERA